MHTSEPIGNSLDSELSFLNIKNPADMLEIMKACAEGKNIHTDKIEVNENGTVFMSVSDHITPGSDRRGYIMGRTALLNSLSGKSARYY